MGGSGPQLGYNPGIMGVNRVSSVWAASVLVVVACGSDGSSESSDDNAGGEAAVPGVGGAENASADGGTVGSGGSLTGGGSGGAVGSGSTGGDVSGGGTAGLAGVGGTGGTIASGGAAGASASGGSGNESGIGGSGGSPPTGGSAGAPALGGAAGTPSSGGTAGTPAAGGSAGTPGTGGTAGAPAAGGAVGSGGAAGAAGAPPLDPCTTRTLAGESDAAEASVLADCNTLWFAGYESANWVDAWGLEWGPSPASNQSLTTTDPLHGANTARVTYFAPGNGPEDQDGYGPDDGVQYMMRFANLSPAVAARDEAYVRYYVRFDPDFDFVLGGKLPGLIGGTAPTGGEIPTGTDGFSARIMWRAGGQVVQYVYHPDITDYGEDMEWNVAGQRYFAPGKWHCVETQIVMNTVVGGAGQYDGVVRSWFDGELALERTDIRFRDVETVQVDGLYFSTFFGGSDATWAPPTNQGAQFDNFVVSAGPIGCCTECDLGDYVPVDPQPDLTITDAELVFDGEQSAWSSGTWSNPGTYDFADTSQNHTSGGSTSASVQFAPGVWDAVYWNKGSDVDLSTRTHVVFWVMPSSVDVHFRVQFRGSANSADVVVNGSPSWFAEGWQVGQWQRVVIPLEDFDIGTNTVDSIYVRSNSDSDPAAPQFYVDDIQIVTASP